MNLTTPQEEFNHIISIYEKCETLDEADKLIHSHFICIALDHLCYTNFITNNVRIESQEIVMDNFNLINSDLKQFDCKYCTGLLSAKKAIEQNRQKEYIQIKIDYLNKLIELCDKESN